MSRDTLPEDLEAMPPGPELPVLLASVDRSDLDSDGQLRLARARSRLVAHQEAQLLADLHAVARKVPRRRAAARPARSREISVGRVRGRRRRPVATWTVAGQSALNAEEASSAGRP
ncbi:MAG: hypothetical protein GEV12_11830 [Micromonosporaceae bacterium]|nr:hypothetical protein [Micromonosporaceae bacterium]